MRTFILAATFSIFGISAAFAGPEFAVIDADRSGGVTMDEVKAAGLSMTEDQFVAADKDQNGLLNENEFIEATL